MNDFTKKLRRNIAAVLLFLYAIFLSTKGILEAKTIGESEFVYLLIGIAVLSLLALGVYKKYRAAEVVAMLIFISSFSATIFSLVGGKDYVGLRDASALTILFKPLYTLLELVIFISLFRIRYRRSRQFTETFQHYKYPTRREL